MGHGYRRWPNGGDACDADFSEQLAAIAKFYLNAEPEQAARSTAGGLAVVARSALGHVRNTYLKPWSAGDVEHKLMAASALSAMAEDQMLSAAALDIATGWARHGGQDRAVTAAIAFGGPLGQRHLAKAMRRLWALTLRDERVSQVASLAFGHLFAVGTETNADQSAIARFLVGKVRAPGQPDAAAHEDRAALAAVNAVLSATPANSPVPSVARMLKAGSADLPPVAQLWAAALNSVQHRRTAVIALHLTLASLPDGADSTDLAVALGSAILPMLTARTREVLELTLPDPQRTEAISAGLVSAFLGAQRDVVGAGR